MKAILLFILLFYSSFLSAQTFLGLLSGSPFEDANLSSVAYADIDGDNDQDVLLTGRNITGLRITKLYINDGAATFSEVLNTPFEGVAAGQHSTAFSDVDSDGDPDVLITGKTDSGAVIAKLYTNDGSGNFTEVPGTPFEGVGLGRIAFADVDADDDPDVLITGSNNSDVRIAKLYTNDGAGNFSEMPGTPFEGVDGGSLAFSDVDGDDDLDVLITGADFNVDPTAKLYINDGAGNFTEVIGTPFEPVDLSSIAFADVDGDEDPDVLITGYASGFLTSANLYLNDGSGDFSLLPGTNLEPVVISSIAFADVDADDDPDVLVTGQIYTGSDFLASSKLYLNDGTGVFSEVMGTPFEEVENGMVSFLDADGDDDSDLIITGRNNASSPSSRLYANDGTGNYTEIPGTPFGGVVYSSVGFMDVNEDEYADILITGENSDGNPISKLFTNDGAGNFSEMAGTPFEGVQASSIAFSDVNGDELPDVLITGKNDAEEPVSKLYANDGSGNFTEVTGTPFEGVQASSIAFSDVNGDDYPDVLVTGLDGSDTPISKLYANDGFSNFSEMAGTPFEGVQRSAIAFSDINGDDYPDLLLTGQNNSGNPITSLYTNDGSGNFTEMLGTPFPGVEAGSVAFADINEDDFPDVLLTGRVSADTAIAKLYINDGAGNFTEVAGTPFEGVQESSIAFADVNKDNYPDMLITGQNNAGNPVAVLYTNDGSGIFAELTETAFEGVQAGSVAFADVNGDEFSDLLITGQNKSDILKVTLYINQGSITDADNDGFPLGEDCDDNNPDVNPGQDEIVYNGLDDDCDPATLDDDLDEDGFLLAEDCDDENPDINPDATEIPNNGIDEDCDGEDLMTATQELGNAVVRVFPNPATTFIYIQKPEHVETQVKLYDATGRLLFSGANSQSINVTEYKSGFYLLEIIHESSNQKMIERIFIQGT